MNKAMAQGIGAAVIAAGLMIAPVFLGPTSFTAARAACEPGDKVDATTADQARKRAEGAGYTQVHMLRKGCDNVWHGTGLKSGASVNLAVLPSGEVAPEGD
ncbi:MAG TPA: hypothetical protein VN823_15625 [Stellaceae bacterium]|nr:hypothetical protein [Stellaceae bacterium]